MADDTRQIKDTSSGNRDDQTASAELQPYRRPKPKHDFPKSQASKMWDALGNPDNPANEMPGGMVNTAGGKPKEVTWRDAFDFSELTREGRPKWYQTGCARDALLVGIGAGGGVGGLHFILRGLSRVQVTANFAVGAFTVTAAGMHYWCTSRQREEAKGIAAAVAGMKLLHEKKAKEKAAEEAAREAARKRHEEEEARRKSWYRFW